MNPLRMSSGRLEALGDGIFSVAMQTILFPVVLKEFNSQLISPVAVVMRSFR